MAVPVTPKIKGTTLQQLLIGRRGWAGFNVDPDTAALSMFDPDGEVTLEQIRAAIGGGGFTSVANIYVAWDAPPGGDGTVGKPFQTIQEGTDKAVAQQAVTASVVFVAAGRYDESPTIDASSLRLAIVGMGGIEFGGLNISVNGQPGPWGAVVWLGSLGSSEGEYVQQAPASRPIIGGQIVFSDAGNNVELSFGGSFWVGSGIDSSAFSTNILALWLRDCGVGGINGNDHTALCLADNCDIGGDVIVGYLDQANNSHFGNMVVTTLGSPQGVLPQGFYDCHFAIDAVFTGPAPFRCDSSTYHTFVVGNCLLVGGAVLDLVDTGLAEQTQYTPTTPGDWSPAPTEVEGALDQLAARPFGGAFPNTHLFWVSVDAPVGGDGSFGRPFNSIQDGIDACPVTAVSTVIVGPGTYTENIAFASSRRRIALVGLGSFRIVGDVDWDVTTGSAADNALWIGTFGPLCGEATFTAQVSRPVILGDITVTGTVGCTLEGSLQLLGKIDSTNTARLAVLLRDAQVSSTISGVNVDLVLADNTHFYGAISVESYGRITNSVFDSTFESVGVGTSPLDFPPFGFFGCSFDLASSIVDPTEWRMDGTTYNTYVGAGCTLPTNYILLDNAFTQQTVYLPGVPSDWVDPPPIDAQDALDRFAATHGQKPFTDSVDAGGDILWSRDVSEGEVIDVEGIVTVTDTGAANTGRWKVQALVKRVPAGNVVIVSGPTAVGPDYLAAALAGCTLTITVDIGTQTVRLEAVGLAATNLRWSPVVSINGMLAP